MISTSHIFDLHHSHQKGGEVVALAEEMLDLGAAEGLQDSRLAPTNPESADILMQQLLMDALTVLLHRQDYL